MNTKRLAIAEIVTNAGTQARVRLNGDVCEEYAAAMHGGANLPPIVVFEVGPELILADGFHRLEAARRNGEHFINATIIKGSRTDAIRHALIANATHGLPRSNADKRRCIEMALSEWPQNSDNELAKMCGVSQPFVGTVRKQLITVIGSEPETRIGADGKERRMPKPKAPAPPPAPAEAATHIVTPPAEQEQPQEAPSGVLAALDTEVEGYDLPSFLKTASFLVAEFCKGRDRGQLTKAAMHLHQLAKRMEAR